MGTGIPITCIQNIVYIIHILIYYFAFLEVSYFYPSVSGFRFLSYPVFLCLQIVVRVWCSRSLDWTSETKWRRPEWIMGTMWPPPQGIMGTTWPPPLVTRDRDIICLCKSTCQVRHCVLYLPKIYIVKSDCRNEITNMIKYGCKLSTYNHC